jgi:hypothetical protein
MDYDIILFPSVLVYITICVLYMYLHTLLLVINKVKFPQNLASLVPVCVCTYVSLNMT